MMLQNYTSMWVTEPRTRTDETLRFGKGATRTGHKPKVPGIALKVITNGTPLKSHALRSQVSTSYLQEL